MIVLNKVTAHTDLNFDSGISAEINYNTKRFPKIFSHNSDHLNVVSGSTYSSKSGQMHQGDVLDSCTAGYIYQEEQVNGMVIAVADGFGGHRDKAEDFDIAEAARVAVHVASDEIAKYKTPDELTDQELPIMQVRWL